MAIDNSSPILTTADAAERLCLATDTVRKFIQRGKIRPFATIGRSHLISEEEIERYLREKQPPGNPNLKRSARRKRA